MKGAVVALGEVLWDLLPAGPLLGGAPANFALHAKALGAKAWLISRVGDDALGEAILCRLEDAGIPTATLQRDPRFPTGTVDVALSAGGQPHYTIREPVAWDAIAVDGVARMLVASADAVCFGSLAQRSAGSRASIRELVRAAPAEALRVFDINLRQDFYSREVVETSLELADVLKLNDAELPIVAEMMGLAGTERAVLGALAERFGLRAVALTKGAAGSVLLSANDYSERGGASVEVVDTIGAGDAFTAALTLGLLAGWPIDSVNARANAVAACVCTQPGATPALSSDLCAAFTSATRLS